MRQLFLLAILSMIIADGLYAQKVGVNITSPAWPLHVREASGTTLTSSQPVFLSEYGGTNTADVIAVKGYSRPGDYYGIGGSFEGGWIGLEGKVVPVGSSYYTGVSGSVTGGSGINYGLYGSASGTGTNWAGYFAAGNVFVNHLLGIGQSAPLWPLDILAQQAAVRLVTTSHNSGSALELKSTVTSPAFIGSINFNNSTETYPGQIAYTGSHELQFRVNGAERMKIRPDGTLDLNSELGIVLDARDRPLITRGWDPFTSGPYNGLGRWGVFMEPLYLTFGIPAIADRGFRFVRYNDNGSIEKTILHIGNGKVGINTTSPSWSLHVREVQGQVLNGDEPVLYAQYTGTNASNVIGVKGYSKPQPGSGTGGFFEGGATGVEGFADGSYAWGVIGQANSTGSFIQHYGVSGEAIGGNGTGTNYGVYGVASGGGTNWAGYFSGNVNVTGTLSKGGGSFKIDHPLDPENKYLYHSFVESPDMMNVYNGNVMLDATGEATVALPEWFDALNRDFRYQLTPIGAPGPNLYVAEEIRDNHFRIAGGAPGSKVSWQVTGIRQDPFANANRIPVEADKKPEDRGTYLHPGAYGRPDTRAEDAKHRQMRGQ